MLVIPSEVLGNAVLSCLSISEWRALDTAYTNKLQRSVLHKAWKSTIYASPIPSNVMTAVEDLVWLRSYDILIVAITLSVKTVGTACQQIVSFLSHNAPDLKILEFKSYLSMPWFTDTMLIDLASGCSQLEHLRIPEASPITDEGIVYLSKQCNQLHTLYLSTTRITDVAILALCANCPHLLHIDISCCDITDTSLGAIAKTYPKLLTLRLRECDFSDEGLVFLANTCHQLQTIHLGGSSNNITSIGLTALLAANPNLLHVDLSHCTSVSPTDIMSLADCCRRIESLHLNSCCQMTDAAIIAIAENCSQLYSFDISYCFLLTDESLLALTKCLHLTKIYVDYCGNLTANALATLAEAVHNILVLHMISVYCDSNSMRRIAVACPLLEKLNCSDTSIDAESIQSLATHCPSLREVRLNSCPNLKTSALELLFENCKCLTLLCLGDSRVEDACLFAIAKYCEKLTDLDICGGSDVTEAGLVAVLQIDSLVRINVTDCDNLKQHELKILSAVFPHIKIVC